MERKTTLCKLKTIKLANCTGENLEKTKKKKKKKKNIKKKNNIDKRYVSRKKGGKRFAGNEYCVDVTIQELDEYTKKARED